MLLGHKGLNNYDLNGGGIKIDGRKYAQTAGTLIIKIKKLLATDNCKEDVRALIKEAHAEFFNKKKSTTRFYFFGLGARAQSTADLYQKCFETSDSYLKTDKPVSALITMGKK